MPKYPEKTIGELCDIIKGETGLASAIPGGYPLVTTGADRKSCNSYQFDTETVCIPLVSSTGHGKKTLNYVHYQEGKFALGTILAALIPRDKNVIAAAYLHRYLQFYKDKKIVPLMKGAANVSLSVKDIAKIDIPLPPIIQQTEFIKLFSKLHIVSSDLQIESTTQSSLLTQLRQSILQEAIEGKLTADWRKTNPVRKGDPEYDAEALLAKIKLEKQKLVEDGKIRKEKPLPPIKKEEIPFELPKGWLWTRLGVVADILGGYAYNSTDFKKDGVNQVLRLGNIRPGSVRLEEKAVFISKQIAENTKNFLLKTNDILVTMTGTRGKRDYLYTVRITEQPYRNKYLYLNQRVGAIRFYFFSDFYEYLFSADKPKDCVFATSTGSANQANVGMIALKNWIIPIPPLSEQKAIADRVEKHLSMVDELEKQVYERKEQSKQLMQSVLREAFEGNAYISENRPKRMNNAR